MADSLNKSFIFGFGFGHFIFFNFQIFKNVEYRFFGVFKGLIGFIQFVKTVFKIARAFSHSGFKLFGVAGKFLAVIADGADKIDRKQSQNQNKSQNYAVNNRNQRQNGASGFKSDGGRLNRNNPPAVFFNRRVSGNQPLSRSGVGKHFNAPLPFQRFLNRRHAGKINNFFLGQIIRMNDNPAVFVGKINESRWADVNFPAPVNQRINFYLKPRYADNLLAFIFYRHGNRHNIILRFGRSFIHFGNVRFPVAAYAFIPVAKRKILAPQA